MRILGTILAAVMVTASGLFTADVSAQTQTPPPGTQRPSPPGAGPPAVGDEKIVEGEVQRVDPSGTELTLRDGTTLVTPEGSAIKPGVLGEGAMVVAGYREQNGKKVLTRLVLREPPASPPTTPRSPGEPQAPPPSRSPTR